MPRDGVHERLILGVVCAGGREGGLTMRLSGKPGGPHVGYPDLHRAQSLAAQSFPMLSHPLTNRRSVALSHTDNVTCNIVGIQR